PLIPPALDHIVTTCLQKDPEDRFLAAHDIKLELRWIATGHSSPAVPAVPTPAPNPRARFAWIAALVAAIALGLLAGYFLNHPAQSTQFMRTIVDAPEKVALNLVGDFAGPPVLSPDGSMLAFAGVGADGKTAIWVR